MEKGQENIAHEEKMRVSILIHYPNHQVGLKLTMKFIEQSKYKHRRNIGKYKKRLNDYR